MLSKILNYTFLACIVTFQLSAYGQSISNYIFSASLGSFTPLTGASPVETVISASDFLADSKTSKRIPIGFTFKYAGEAYTEVTVMTDGYLSFNPLATNQNANNLATSSTTWRPIIAPFWDNLSGASGANPSASYQTSGSPGFRVFTVEWLNWQWGASTTGAQISFQVRLFEENGKIEFCYRQEVGIANVTSASIGLTGFGTGSGNFISLGDVSAHPVVSSTAEVSTISARPVTGQVYSFLPVGNPSNAPSGITFSNLSQDSMTINWTDNANNETFYKILRSDDNGFSFRTIALLPANTIAYHSNGLLPNKSYLYRIVAGTEFNSTDSFVQASQTTLSGNTISSIVSGNWTDPSVWSGGIVPTEKDSVVISDGTIITINSTTAKCYSLLVGTGLSGVLQYQATPAASLTVIETIYISANANFHAGTGSLGTHNLFLGGTSTLSASGSIINNGTFDMQKASAGVIVSFLGGNDAVVSGSGSITNFRTININKNSNQVKPAVVSFNLPFTVQGGNTLGLISTHVAGVIRIGGTQTQSNLLYTTAAYTIPSGAGVWLDNPNFTITPRNSNATLAGSLKITNGIYNIGTTSATALSLSVGCSLIIEGGQLNCSSRLNSANAITFSMSGGEIKVSTVGNTTNAASFGFTNTATNFSQTGGVIMIIQPNTNVTIANRADYVVGPFNSNPILTGGLLKVGHSSTNTNFNFRIRGEVYSILIDSLINNKQVTLNGNLSVLGKIMVPQNGHFSLNGFTVVMKGDTILNDGFIDGRVINSTLVFSAAYVSYYCGIGSDTLSILEQQSSFYLDIQKSITAYRIAFTGMAPIKNAFAITIGDGSTNSTVQFGKVGGSIAVGNFDSSPTLNIGTGTYSVEYLQESAPRITGIEIPATRSIANLVVNNSHGVILNGGDLSITGFLNLLQGRFISSDMNVLRIMNTSPAASNAGSSTSYVSGPLSRVIPALNFGLNNYIFPVGKTEYTRLDLVNPYTQSGNTEVLVESFADSTGGSPDNSSISQISKVKYLSIAIIGSNYIDSSTLRLYDNSLTGKNRLAFSSNITGTYSSISNGPTANSLTSTTSLSLLSGYYTTGEAIIPIPSLILVGSSQPDISLTGLFTKISGMQLQGNVEIRLQSDYNSQNETFPILLPELSRNNPSWTVTIKPELGTDVVISGNSATAIIHFNGGDKYILDGSNSNSESQNLTIENLNTNITNNSVIWLSSWDINKGANDNCIKNCIIKGSGYNRTLMGIYLGSDTIIDRNILSSTPSYRNQFINNKIGGVRNGLVLIGSTNISDSGHVVKQNEIGFSNSEQILHYGMVLINQRKDSVLWNEVSNVFASSVGAYSLGGFQYAAGIYLGNSDNVLLSGNRIHDIKATVVNATGILLNSTAYVNDFSQSNNVVVNNAISGIVGLRSWGIGTNGGYADTICFNSVYLNDSMVEGGAFYNGMASIYSRNLVLLNNSFVVIAPYVGNGSVFAHYTTSNNYFGSTIDYNNLYVKKLSGPGSAFFGLFTSSLSNRTSSLLAWKNLTGVDLNSISIDPLYQESVNLLPYIGTLQGLGTKVAGLDRDILDTLRSTPPSIGAYETGKDLIGPVITFAKISNTTSLTGPTLTDFALITDDNGVKTTIGSAPRLYFKKTSDDNIFGSNNPSVRGWKYVESVSANSPFTFTLDFSLLHSSASMGDEFQYFIVAEDTLGNVSANPKIGFSADGIINVLKAPDDPFKFKIVDQPLSGVYEVGNGKIYPTLTIAIKDLNERGVNGPVVFSLTDPTYTSLTESFPLQVTKYAGASSLNSVLIRPDTFINVIIESDIASSLFRFDGTGYITLSGVDPKTGLPHNLMINNKDTTGNTAEFVNDASNILLQGVQILGAADSMAFGVVTIKEGVINGNDSIILDNCFIKGNTIKNPVNLVFAKGNTTTLSAYNDHNYILNCQLSDYARQDRVSSAIKMLDGNNNWQIIGNSIFQSTSSFTSRDIFVFNLNKEGNPFALNNIIVKNNFIGGSSPYCAGTPWVASSLSNFSSYFNMGTKVTSSFTHNTISNIDFTTTSNSDLCWNTIHLAGGKLRIDSNLVGSITDVNSIVVHGGHNASVSIFSINSDEQDTFSVIGNKIGGISVDGGGLGATNFKVINVNVMSNRPFVCNIIGNSIGNLLDKNIQVNEGKLFAIASNINGLFGNSSNASFNIQDNVIQNLFNRYSALPQSINSVIGGIYIRSGSHIITGNTITTLINEGLGQSNGTIEASLLGILSFPTLANNVVSKNSIIGLIQSDASTFPNTINGILSGGNQQVVIEANYLDGYITKSVNGEINGIHSLLGKKRIYNNIVRLGVDTLGSTMETNSIINGIKKSGGDFSLFNNTIAVIGTNVNSGVNRTSCLYRATSGVDSVANNIFFNARFNISFGSGNGGNFAVAIEDTANFFANRNIFYAEPAYIGDTLFRIGQNTIPQMAMWRQQTRQDYNSLDFDPNFLNLYGVQSPSCLHLNSPTAAEGSGMFIDNVIFDFDGQMRISNTPNDIGADAGNFVGIDLFAPIISYKPIEKDTLSSSLTLHQYVSITDPSGVEVSTYKPRLYFKKTTDADMYGGSTSMDDGWKVAEAVNTTSPFDFIIDYTKLYGGIPDIQDTIEYYVVAQDNFGNVGAEPSQGFAANNVSSILVSPESLRKYIIRETPLRGVYKVGVTPSDYPTITSAVKDLEVRGMDSDVVFELKDIEYSTSETFPILISNLKPANSAFLTIRPTAGINSIIQGSSTTALINILNSRNVIITGGNTGTLTMKNANAQLNTAVIWLQTINSDSLKNIKLENLDIIGEYPSVNNTFGLIISGGSLSSSSGALLDSFVFNHNKISGVSHGVHIRGIQLGSIRGVHIEGNSFGLSQKAISSIGLNMQNASQITIRGNSFRNIGGSTFNGTGLGPVAINLGSGTQNILISQNIIDSVWFTAGGNYGGKGIVIQSVVANSNILLVNNMISNIKGEGSNDIHTSNVGVYIAENCSGLRIYNNTIAMAGQIQNSSLTRCASAYIGNATSNIECKNNIFINTINNGQNNLSRSYSLYLDNLVASGTSVNLDYNNYWVSGSQGRLAYIGGDLISLSSLQTLTGADAGSKSILVNFVSEGDLHLNGLSIGDVNLIGLPIPFVINDIDGDVRNSLYPYIGADENIGTSLPVLWESFNVNYESPLAHLIWSTSSESNNRGFEIERSIDNGYHFENIGFLKGKNKTTTTTYQFTDFTLIDIKWAIVYYRLKQLDRDGKTSMSPVISIHNLKKANKLTISHINPVLRDLKMDIDAQEDIKGIIHIIDALGKVQYSLPFYWTMGSQLVTVGMANIPAGMYTVLIHSNSECIKNFKIIKY